MMTVMANISVSDDGRNKQNFASRSESLKQFRQKMKEGKDESRIS